MKQFVCFLHLVGSNKKQRKQGWSMEIACRNIISELFVKAATAGLAIIRPLRPFRNALLTLMCWCHVSTWRGTNVKRGDNQDPTVAPSSDSMRSTYSINVASLTAFTIESHSLGGLEQHAWAITSSSEELCRYSEISDVFDLVDVIDPSIFILLTRREDAVGKADPSEDVSP
jgi:hypothetical protein